MRHRQRVLCLHREQLLDSCSSRAMWPIKEANLSSRPVISTDMFEFAHLFQQYKWYEAMHAGKSESIAQVGPTMRHLKCDDTGTNVAIYSCRASRGTEGRQNYCIFLMFRDPSNMCLKWRILGLGSILLKSRHILSMQKSP